jgi:hypothetical protein
MDENKITEIITNHTEQIARHDEQLKQQSKDISDVKVITQLIYEISSDIKLLFQQGTVQTEKLGKVETRVDKLSTDMENVRDKEDKKDAKKWNDLVKSVILLVTGAIIGFALKQIGL